MTVLTRCNFCGCCWSPDEAPRHTSGCRGDPTARLERENAELRKQLGRSEKKRTQYSEMLEEGYAAILSVQNKETREAMETRIGMFRALRADLAITGYRSIDDATWWDEMLENVAREIRSAERAAEKRGAERFKSAAYEQANQYHDADCPALEAMSLLVCKCMAGKIADAISRLPVEEKEGSGG